jgi:hypothetical protein
MFSSRIKHKCCYARDIAIPREEDKRISGDSGEVAMLVTHPECPLRVPRNARVSI